MKVGNHSKPLAGRVSQAVRVRVVDPTLRLLKQGMTPRAIAASMATGAVIGVFPVVGTSTALCLVVALVLRLNLVAIQALNWLVYPVQVLLVIPFIELGQRLSSAPALTLSLAEIQAVFERGWLQAVAGLWTLLVDAMLGWAVVAVPAWALVYVVLHGVVHRAGNRRRQR